MWMVVRREISVPPQLKAETQSQTAVTLKRMEQMLRKLYVKKPPNKKRKLHEATTKSFLKELERSNLNAENGISVSNDSVSQTIPGSHHCSWIKERPHVSSSYNVYTYYYPKYDMSYGHCLYVTPQTLEVPAYNTLQIAPIVGDAVKELRQLSLERNWKTIGWKRRVNAARRSFTFPANAEWDSTIYYFPRWDLSFYPLPMSRIRPAFGNEAAFPVETVLEEEDGESTLASKDLGSWKDLVEFEEKTEQHSSCLNSARTDVTSRSTSSIELLSMDDLSIMGKLESPGDLGERTTLFLPGVSKDNWISSRSQIPEKVNPLQMNQSQLSDDIDSKREAEKLRFNNYGQMKMERLPELKPMEDLSHVANHINSPHKSYSWRTRRYQKCHTRFSVEVNYSKSVKESNLRTSHTEDYKSRLCTECKPSKSFKMFEHNLVSLENVPKGVSYNRDSKLVENKQGALAVFCGDERKRVNECESAGVESQRQIEAAGRRHIRAKGRRSKGEIHEGNVSLKNNLLSGDPRSRVGLPLYLGDCVLLEDGIEPGDRPNAELRVNEDNSTMTKDDLFSTNNVNCETFSVNEMDDTIADGHLGGGFGSDCSNMSTRRDIKGHTFLVSALSVNEAKDMRITLKKQAHTSKPRQCRPMLAVGSLHVDCDVKRSSFSMARGFFCKSRMIIRSRVIFDVGADKHNRNRSAEEGTSDECNRPLCVPKSNHSRMHSVDELLKEGVPKVDKQKTALKRLKVERKTAMQKLVFVRSSAAEVSHGTRSGDRPFLRHGRILSQESAIEFTQRRNVDRKGMQMTTRQTQKDAKDWCKPCRFVEFTQSESFSIGIQNIPKPRLGMFQDLQPAVIREAPKTYLSIWQQKRARHADFLKRNPPLTLFPSQLKTE